MAKSPLRWEDPPPSRGAKDQTLSIMELLAPLVQNKDCWAVLEEAPAKTPEARQVQQHAAAIRRLENAKRTPGKFITTTREKDGKMRLYVKYVGPLDEPPSQEDENEPQT
jgi:hypothetical protein